MTCFASGGVVRGWSQDTEETLSKRGRDLPVKPSDTTVTVQVTKEGVFNMSWSFNAQGLSRQVLEKANIEFTSYKCVEPEQTARTSCLSILQNVLVVWPEDAEVKVEMYGSQSTTDSGITNNLSVKIGLP